MTDYGQDVSTYPALDTSGVNISQGRAIAECAVRRLMTGPDVLEYAESESIDLREYLSRDLTDGDLFELEGEAERVLELDERVASAKATVTLASDGASFSISVAITPEEGKTFVLVVAVTAFTVELLSVD